MVNFKTNNLQEALNQQVFQLDFPTESAVINTDGIPYINLFSLYYRFKENPISPREMAEEIAVCISALNLEATELELSHYLQMQLLTRFNIRLSPKTITIIASNSLTSKKRKDYRNDAAIYATNPNKNLSSFEKVRAIRNFRNEAALSKLERLESAVDAIVDSGVDSWMDVSTEALLLLSSGKRKQVKYQTDFLVSQAYKKRQRVLKKYISLAKNNIEIQNFINAA